MWPVDLSVRLPVFGLVSFHLTNCLIGHKSLLKRISAFHLTAYGVLAPVSRRCPPLSDTSLCFTHPSAARMIQFNISLVKPSSPNLHVLSTPPAFVLSQDQTLRRILLSLPTSSRIALRLASLPRPLRLSRNNVARSPAALSSHGGFHARNTTYINATALFCLRFHLDCFIINKNLFVFFY